MTMKLRNKKTGEIVDFQSFQFYQRDNCKYPSNIFESLSALNEEWEDYKPAEPLIKDEKIRKAVRAWAEADDLFEDIEISTLTAGTRFSMGHYDIEFMGYFIYDLESDKTYAIAELCGEEEE